MKYFITGVTGTLGQIVCQKLLENQTNEVIGYSRDECKQAQMARQANLTLYLGDIRDSRRLCEATRGADTLFHFAALKHVDQLESNPEEAISTNIIGTQNVLLAQRTHKIKRVVLSATDKGAYPINVYGMSKGIAERLVLRNSNNVVCRYGNVLASRGSVVELMVKTLKNEGKVYLTDPNMTRFWITQTEAANFVISQSDVKKGGLKIPPMKGATLGLLAEIVSDLMKIKSYEVEKIPVRPGEKTHECLRTLYEGEEMHSHQVPQFEFDELRDILRPIVKALA